MVRHLRPDIKAGRCYGRLDLGLHANARSELAPLARALAETGIGTVWTSPARRCRMLAEAVTDQALCDDRLQELDFGAWEGIAWDRVPREALDAWVADPLGFAPPGGETGAELIARVGAFCAGIRASGQDCVVISHGGPLKIIPAVLASRPPDLLGPAPPFGSITTLTLASQALVEARTVSTAHSVRTAEAPSTSPV